MSYGMVIDLEKCVNCRGCVLSCKEANGTPPGTMRSRVERETTGTYPDTKADIVPMLCMHCENAPCIEACAVEGATYKRDDGIVVVDKEKCIGCKLCMEACPYDARHYRENDEGYFGEELNEYEETMYAAMPSNTVDKCDFCQKKVEAGETPACVAACIAKARHFGELEELKSQYIDGTDAFQLLPDEGTNPSVWYLPSVDQI